MRGKGFGFVPSTGFSTLTLLCMAGVAHAQATQAPPSLPSPPATITVPARAPTALTEGLKPFKQAVPAAAFEFEMLPVPGDPAKGIQPFYIGATELTWEAFDVFVYSLDAGGTLNPDGSSDADGNDRGAGGRTVDDAPEDAANADAITRPSKPYLPPDRGFGHKGFAAICVSFKNAQEFCKWLSKSSGRTYRLPTQDEWEHAARAGSSGAFTFGDDPAKLGDYAWFIDNADGQPRAVGTKKPNAFGLFDVHGNVAEWCIGRDGKPVVMGGSYRDGAEKLTATSAQTQSSAWNASDPQIPKSKWWLADGPHVGFRVVCEPLDTTIPVKVPAPKAPAEPAPVTPTPSK